jgi:hypothetical protein
MKHTPLPWNLEKLESDTQGYRRSSAGDFAVIAENLMTPCFVFGIDPEGQANAEFIVKAVNCHYELLWALKHYVAEWDYNHKSESHITGITTPPSSYYMAKEAIAKAKGE